MRSTPPARPPWLTWRSGTNGFAADCITAYMTVLPRSRRCHTSFFRPMKPNSARCCGFFPTFRPKTSRARATRRRSAAASSGNCSTATGTTRPYCTVNLSRPRPHGCPRADAATFPAGCVKTRTGGSSRSPTLPPISKRRSPHRRISASRRRFTSMNGTATRSTTTIRTIFPRATAFSIPFPPFKSAACTSCPISTDASGTRATAAPRTGSFPPSPKPAPPRMRRATCSPSITAQRRPTAATSNSP